MPPRADTQSPSQRVVISALGVAQILAWGTSFYFPAVFAKPIVADTGWSLGYVVSGTSIGLLIAGLVSPRVGHLIDRRGGRPVLLSASLLFAVGLTGVGLAPTLPLFLLAWAVLGLGMGCGLYDAAFATLGRIYGREARGPITSLTLFGGFSGTICWPLSAFLIDSAGWRGACLIYAALHLALALPLQAAVVRSQPVVASHPQGAPASGHGEANQRDRLLLMLFGAILSIAAGVGSTVIVHIMIFLQARGLDFAAAVVFATLIGPAQVGARFVERLFGSRYHPVWTMVAAGVLMAIGLVQLLCSYSLLFVAIILYGAGYGISWIARGTVPLALFGPARFPRLMGLLAFPSLIVQALAPAAGAWLIETNGANATIGVLTGLAVINVVLIGLLWIVCRPVLMSET